ncbi:Structural maintenance of chromosomes protein 5 [Clarireedia jacksonii]
MAPQMPYRRRRSRSQMEEDDEEDAAQSSAGSTPLKPAKRPRANGYHSESEPESPNLDNSETVEDSIEGSHPRRQIRGPHHSIPNGESTGFAPGAILRVKLTNFITYDDAEFFPGPNLNMVIGPNGTGKSSLVCAFCLGLGADPKLLGRATKFGEFVKHGMSDAFVEIELQRRPHERENHIIKLRIIKDGDNREWWLNGKKSNHKNVTILTRSLNIQIDNLCQFLPQDRVSEFSGLTPVDLLHQTLRAVAPQEMLDWHEELKTLRKAQKTKRGQFETDKEQLANLQQRQNNLRPEVERLEERAEAEKKLVLLTNTIPFVEYRTARNRHIQCKNELKEADKRLKRLESRVEPTLRLVNEKEELERELAEIVKDRKKCIDIAEKGADDILRAIEQWTEQIQECERRITAEREGEEKRKKDLAKIRRHMLDLEARLREPAIEFDPKEYNDRITAINHEMKGIQDRVDELTKKNEEIKTVGRTIRAEQEKTKQALIDFDSQAGRQVNKIAQYSKDTARAWKWVQENKDKFEKEVYGPPLITCSVKDPRYTDLVEALFQQSNVLTITAQTQTDYKTLVNQFHSSEMKLAEFRVQTSVQSLSETMNPPQASAEQLRQLSLDGWAIDFIDGPEPVLAMLCNDVQAHRAAVTLRELDDDQHQRINNSGISSFLTRSTMFKITRRREYGPNATSTRTSRITPAKYFVDGVVDTSGRREIEEKLEALDKEFEEKKKETHHLKAEMQKLVSARQDRAKDMDKIKEEKNMKQKALGEQKALPGQINREKENLERLENAAAASRKAIQEIMKEQDTAGLKKGADVLKHIEKIKEIVACHDELDEAETRRIEAESDIAALRERNIGIVQKLDAERALVARVKQESQEATKTAKRALERCKQISSEAEATNQEDLEYFRNIPEGKTVEELENEIKSEQNKLELIQAYNPNAIRDFKKRQAEIEKLESRLGNTEEDLNSIEQQTNHIMQQWEPRLDALVAEIGQAFSDNFEQIGCAGEVGVYKEDDFENWAIEIKVKFRESETLQLLDKHRQSGGERSVSTIFYLMSLQSLAVAPFRVVDEINQGMDPRNERMVHGRMVEIACQVHTSQYFLITPKLLHDLRYDRRMKVLCIASGEFMPGEQERFSVKGVIEKRRMMGPIGVSA